jgi:YggT family protein
VLQPVFAQEGFAGHHASSFGHHVAAPRVARRAKRGGARRDRTADLVIANDALSQLSYGPIAAPFTIRPKVKSRTAKSPFSALWPGTSLVCGGWNRYLAGSLSRDRTASKSLPMRALLEIIQLVLDLYVYLLIASAILSWLIAFNVVNTRNQLVAAIAEFLYRITEPLLAPIRSFMPNLGGLDISPIILIIIIIFIQKLIAYNVMPYFQAY